MNDLVLVIIMSVGISVQIGVILYAMKLAASSWTIWDDESSGKLDPWNHVRPRSRRETCHKEDAV